MNALQPKASAPQCEICSTRKDVVERMNGAKICKPCLEAFRRTYRAMNRITKSICKKRAKPRRGPMRDPKYRRWLRMRLCHVHASPCECLGRIDPAHTQNNGMSSKGPDSSCVPLCRKHHAEYDGGREAFEAKYGVNMRYVAATCYLRYLTEKGTD